MDLHVMSAAADPLKELKGLLEQAQAQLAEADPLASCCRARAEQAASAASERAAHAKGLEKQLEDWLRQAHTADQEAASSEARLQAILDQAASELQELSKRQLDEVRALPYPPRVVQRSLALVYCLLRPQDTQRFVALGGVPWKEKLAPMLKKDELIQKMMAFPPPQEKHPLIAYPQLRSLIESQVATSDRGEAVSESQAKVCESIDLVTAASSSQPVTPRDTGGQGKQPVPQGRSPMHSAATLVLKRHSLDSTSDALSHNESNNSAKFPTGIVHARRAATVMLNRHRSKAKLFEGERLTLEAVAFASSAMGAIFSWLLAQLRYVRIIEAEDLMGCEGQAANARQQRDAFQTRISELRMLVAEAQAQLASAEEVAANARSESEHLAEEVSRLVREIEDLKRKIGAWHQAEANRHRLAEAERKQAELQKRKEEERRQEDLRRCREIERQQEEARRLEEQQREEARRLEEQRREDARRQQEKQRFEEEQRQRIKKLHDFEDRIKDWKKYVKVPPAKVTVPDQLAFEVGSAEMSSGGKHAIKNVADVLRANLNVKLSLQGQVMPNENDSLCLARAEKALEALVELGISRHRLRATGNSREYRSSPGARVDFKVIQELSIQGTIQFSPCSDQLTSESTSLVDSVAGFLLAETSVRLRVEGHTDNSPNWGCSNQVLSGDRAQSVARHLGSLGVDMCRIQAVGFGDSLPRVSNSTREGRAQNRRVEFHVM
eukprot:TRINITY_DN78588_c0_g1_i1.p1 TRINITY_DN78588_c0_g1~~TRINITY_DN78588_c0_g1_i1.p1  ORF type:complete len:724 (-),score=131.48 TRINITY_DN78588_c0_g1_i1:274-2445(-)